MKIENTKKSFAAPTLTVYGDVRQLTAKATTSVSADNPLVPAQTS